MEIWRRYIRPVAGLGALGALVAASVVAGLALAQAAESDAVPPPGKAVYDKNCAACHAGPPSLAAERRRSRRCAR